MKCNQCGAEIPDDSIYCEQCGKKLDLGGKRPSTKMLIWLGVAALAIVAVVLIFTLSGNSKGGEDEPGNGIETAANTIKDGDSDVVKVAKLMDQYLRVMEMEPNATNYKKMVEIEFEMKKYNADFDESCQALAKINPDYPDREAIERKARSLTGKWNNWFENHKEEAERIVDDVDEAYNGEEK